MTPVTNLRLSTTDYMLHRPYLRTKHLLINTTKDIEVQVKLQVTEGKAERSCNIRFYLNMSTIAIKKWMYLAI